MRSGDVAQDWRPTQEQAEEMLTEMGRFAQAAGRTMAMAGARIVEAFARMPGDFEAALEKLSTEDPDSSAEPEDRR
jgi:hypothetical protein